MTDRASVSTESLMSALDRVYCSNNRTVLGKLQGRWLEKALQAMLAARALKECFPGSITTTLGADDVETCHHRLKEVGLYQQCNSYIMCM